MYYVDKSPRNDRNTSVCVCARVCLVLSNVKHCQLTICLGNLATECRVLQTDPPMKGSTCVNAWAPDAKLTIIGCT